MGHMCMAHPVRRGPPQFFGQRRIRVGQDIGRCGEEPLHDCPQPLGRDADLAIEATEQRRDEAVRLANDTDFGLSAAIISNSVGRAMAMGEQLRVGLLHINDQTVNDEVVNPFGGVGASGNGTSIGGPANWGSSPSGSG